MISRSLGEDTIVKLSDEDPLEFDDFLRANICGPSKTSIDAYQWKLSSSSIIIHQYEHTIYDLSILKSLP